MWDVLDDFIRNDLTMRLLRPLLEGLAVFAECDVLPSNISPIDSPIVHWVARVFGKKYAEIDEHPLGAWRFLVQYRFGEEFLRRKESLLAGAIRDVEDGYLASYLFAKDMWTAAAVTDDRLRDTDLFLAVVRSYFFCDLGMVAHILDPGTKNISSATAIGEYFSDRMARLARDGFSDLVDPVIEKALGSTLEHPFPSEQTYAETLADLTNLGTEPTLWHEGAARLKDILEEIEPSEDSLGNLSYSILAQREMMGIGRLEVTVRVTDENRIVCSVDEDLRILAGPMDEPVIGQIGPGQYQGTVGVYLLPYRGIAALAVSVDGRALLTMCGASASPEMRDAFRRFSLDVGEVSQRSESLRAFIEQLVTSAEGIETVLDVGRESIRDWYQDQYVGQVLRCIPAAQRTAQIDLLDQVGFGSALGGRLSLRRLTWLSIAATMSPGFKSVQGQFDRDRWFHQFDGPVEECIRELQTIAQNALGESLIFTSNGSFWSAV